MQKKWQFLFSLAFGAIWMLCLYFTFDATLSLTQLHLSDGVTAYSPLVGSLVLTGLLLLLQRLVQRFTRFRQSCFLLTFFPSTAVLVLLTSFVSGVSLFAVIVTSVLAFAWCVMAVMESFRHENVVVRPLKAASWFWQILLFFLLVFYMGAMGNSKDVYRYEVQTARLLRAGHYHEALEVGKTSLATTQYLTAMRAYAMGKIAKSLGDQLFHFPLPENSGSRSLLLLPSDSLSLLFSSDSLYRLLGVPPYDGKQSPTDYLAVAAKRHSDGAAGDYYLCALLLDKQLERFATELQQFYVISDTAALPAHYAEALILYNRIHPNPSVIYENANITANYLDFKEKGRSISWREQRSNLLRREYGDTYWWYYFYHGQ